VPLRLRKTEAVIRGKSFSASMERAAREAAMSEVQPIDDIRSTAAYRSAVLGNLVAEFLQRLRSEAQRMIVLSRWNQLPRHGAIEEILPCCGSQAWAQQLAGRRPFSDSASLIANSDAIWNQLGAADWMEAFSKHPRIGERKAPPVASTQSAAWSAQEQQSVGGANESVQVELAEANREYERRFGRIFIVCATGKSASEMLDILRRRLQNDDATELRVAAEEQRKITNIRIEKWLTQ
jgi:2-oxo-4-hydroxy-4-carboxy-5-ureidoimidazoline decarboxylase